MSRINLEIRGVSQQCWVILLLSLFTVASNAAEPDADTISAYSDQDYRDLVKKYSIDSGKGINYAAWNDSPEDLQLLQSQVDLIAAVSPKNRPELFSEPHQERRYWINTYNALVLSAVLEYWPIESVRKVKLSLTSRLIPGKGFFYDRDIVVGGEETSLLKMEKEVLRTQKEPRLHFALNCASRSCPVIRPSKWSEDELDLATRDFINNPENVFVEDGTVHLSQIFKWYKKDFPRDIYTHLRRYANEELDAQLAEAVSSKYRKRYVKYDWSLND